MPTELLFDIAGIDLSQVAVTAEEVGKLNPQAGDMRHLDYLVWTSEDNSEALGVKEVGPDEFWVPGHIPGRPLLPGVLMIEAAAQVSSILYRLKSKEERFLGFTRCDNVVFRGQVQPGDRLYLLTREISFKARRFISANQGIVDGKLVFEAKITGMVI